MRPDALNEFSKVIAGAGLHLTDPPSADGIFHRVPTADDERGDKSGWYVLYDGEVPAAAYGDWRTGLKEKWHAKPEKKLTAEEYEKVKAVLAEARKQADAEREREHEEVAKEALRLWNLASPADPAHPYLKEKGVQPHGLRVGQGSLIVPLREGRTIWSLEFISPGGDKRFLTGGRKRGCYFLLGKVDQQTPDIVLAEGFATAASLRESTDLPVVVAMDAGNLKPVAERFKKNYSKARLLFCADNDESKRGEEAARDAARAVGGIVVVCPEPGDFNDLHQSKGLEEIGEVIRKAVTTGEVERVDLMPGVPIPEKDPLPGLIERSKKDPGAPFEPGVIRALAELRQKDRAGYERLLQELKTESKVRIGEVEALVKALSSSSNKQDEKKQGKALTLADPEPWPDPVDGEELLGEAVSIIKKYLVLPKWGAEAMALWTAFSYSLDAFEVTPRLAFISPDKRCGKTTALKIMKSLVPRPLPAANITGAVIFRVVELARPTLIVDEMDSFIEGKEELRGILNSGHERELAQIIRSVGDDHDPRSFSTWAAYILAMIGRLPDTLADRSIIISMQRKKSSEGVERVRRNSLGPLADLGRKFARWSLDNFDALSSADPEVPESLNDRAQDNWRPLLAVSDLAGGEWPRMAREAALALSGGTEADVDSSIGTRLLSDLRDLFTGMGVFKGRESAEKIGSKEVCEALAAVEERPWGEWGRKQEAISPHQLSKLLRPFGIEPRSLNIGGRSFQGYHLRTLSGIFSRYLPPQTPIPRLSNEDGPYSEKSKPDPENESGSENPENGPETKGNRGIGFRKGGPLGKEGNEADEEEARKRLNQLQKRASQKGDR